MPELELDEKAVDKAAQALCIALGSACPITMYSDHHAVAASVVRTYLKASGLVSLPVVKEGGK